MAVNVWTVTAAAAFAAPVAGLGALPFLFVGFAAGGDALDRLVRAAPRG